MIATWWADLSPVMKLLWSVTLTATLIFVIQTVMTFLGADADGTDFDMDVDTSMDGSDLSNIEGGSNLYTFRNLVNFFLGFGWSAILLQPSVKSTALLIFVSVLVGVALVVAVMYLFKWLSSMQQSGNINVYMLPPHPGRARRGREGPDHHPGRRARVQRRHRRRRDQDRRLRQGPRGRRRQHPSRRRTELLHHLSIWTSFISFSSSWWCSS